MTERIAEMTRPVATDRIGEGPTRIDVAAEAAELGAIAARLLVSAVSRVAASFDLRRLPDGMFAAEGRLEAALTRECVVSLEAFEEQVVEDFTLVFVRADRLVEEDDPEAPDQIPYENGAIDLGEAAVEQLALAMDPFPRKPGSSSDAAAVTGAPAQAQAAETTRPFAGLAEKLRGKS